jgi:hypothetical protein
MRLIPTPSSAARPPKTTGLPPAGPDQARSPRLAPPRSRSTASVGQDVHLQKKPYAIPRPDQATQSSLRFRELRQ